MKHPNDTDLNFLKEKCKKEELEFLVRLIIDVGGMTNKLERKANFKLYHPDHTKYADEIIEEIQLYAGNTAMNCIRGYGVAYIEALKGTLRNLDVGFDKSLNLGELEDLLLGVGLDRYLDKMKTVKDKENFRRMLDNVGICSDIPAVVGLVDSIMVAIAGIMAWISPASRVVIPAVIYIANLRKRMIAQGRV